MQKLSYCAQLVRNNDRDRFLAALFIPETHREALFALIALNVELVNVRGRVVEEMIGHIRYAWWQEALEEIIAGKKPRQQPVLEALALSLPLKGGGSGRGQSGSQEKTPSLILPPIGGGDLLKLAVLYREQFPQLPDASAIMNEMTLNYLLTHCPEAMPRWQKANNIVAKHRKRHKSAGGWLAFKLLLLA